MSALIIIMILAWMITQDVVYGIKGQPPPRKAVRLAEIEAGIAQPSYGLSGWARDLKDDVLREHTRRRRDRARRQPSAGSVQERRQPQNARPGERITNPPMPGPAVNAVPDPAPAAAPAPQPTPEPAARPAPAPGRPTAQPNAATRDWNNQIGRHLNDDTAPTREPTPTDGDIDLPLDNPPSPAPAPPAPAAAAGPSNVIPLFPIRPHHQTDTEGDDMAATTDAPTAEITGLQSAINYADAMAEAITQQSGNVEQYVGALTRGKVSADAECVAAAGRAREAMQVAAGAWQACAAELRRQLVVKEAYQGVPEAGDRQFVTAE